jgi:hypothetical protein
LSQSSLLAVLILIKRTAASVSASGRAATTPQPSARLWRSGLLKNAPKTAVHGVRAVGCAAKRGLPKSARQPSARCRRRLVRPLAGPGSASTALILHSQRAWRGTRAVHAPTAPVRRRVRPRPHSSAYGCPCGFTPVLSWPIISLNAAIAPCGCDRRLFGVAHCGCRACGWRLPGRAAKDDSQHLFRRAEQRGTRHTGTWSGHHHISIALQAASQLPRPDRVSSGEHACCAMH